MHTRSALVFLGYNMPNQPQKTNANRLPPEQIILQAVAPELPPGITPEQFVRHLSELMKSDPSMHFVRVQDTLFLIKLEPDRMGGEVHVFAIDKNPQQLAQQIAVLAGELKKQGLHYMVGREMDPGMIKIVQMSKLPITPMGDGAVRVNF
jgi:hypothetical protein